MTTDDHCTLAPDLNFSLCCAAHDDAYGDPKSNDRRAADRHLRLCIRAHGWRVLSWIYWCAVRCFGWYFWDRDRPITRAVDAVFGAPVRLLRKVVRLCVHR